MSREVLVLREPEIRSLLDHVSCIAAIEAAFAAYAIGRAELPSVIHLDVPEAQGEIHIKAGYIHGGSAYAVKVASGFPSNPSLGQPANDGLVLVFDARTGVPIALLFDNGFITDLRTAAAGAVAAKHLAPRDPDVVGVVGSGTQARMQVELLSRVRSFGEVRVWGRSPERARRCVEDIGRLPSLPKGCRVAQAASVAEAVDRAGIVITVTASRVPLVEASWLAPGSLVLAVGSDGADKQELHADVLARADRVVADSLAQCRRIGEIHHALEAGLLADTSVSELGRIVSGLEPGRREDRELIVCDLTGVGVQDVAAAALVVERARAQGLSQEITR
jgi:ornithine cyclodeaminase/alanine dehydrogenase-like protein (mu-crystallin family)